ncbi:MAG: Omp28-related outer membrane protein [Alistipes sp.]|nr:Omp28-related outer membrane protein [Alistipes sp.]
MNRLIKILYVIVAALLSFTSCLKGDGVDFDGAIEKGFVVGVTATSIAADGKDYSTLVATFNNQPIAAEELTIYDATTDQPVEWDNLTFSSLVAGEYQFYVTYTDAEGVTHKSEIIIINVVAKINLDTLDEKGLTARVTTNVIETGKGEAIFIIRYNGSVLTGEELAKVKVYTVDDSGQNQSITLDTDAEYGLLCYTSNVSDIKRFWFSYKTSSTINTVLKVTTVTFPIPSRPIDSNPASTTFNYRAMFAQFTSLTCGVCPQLLCAFETLAEDSEYGKHFTFAAIHSSDNIANTESEKMSSDYNISSFPVVLCNLNASINGSYGYAQDLANIKGLIDSGKANPCKAAIAARTSFDGKTLLVRTAIKVAENGEYRVGAWVLENDVYGIQTNYNPSTATELGYNLNYHRGVVRSINSIQSGRNYTGYDLGTIIKGDTVEHLFDIAIDEGWVANNCQVLLFVTAKQNNGNYVVVNSIMTPSLEQGVDFEYAK